MKRIHRGKHHNRNMLTSRGYAAQSATEALAPFLFERRDPGPSDVVVDIQYCGVCHTDIHMTRNDWGMSVFPMVPGHEIVGRVSRVGDSVKKFKSRRNRRRWLYG